MTNTPFYASNISICKQNTNINRKTVMKLLQNSALQLN